MMFASIASLLFAVSAPVADATTHSVTFTASATGIGVTEPVEFIFAGKGSDRDYETLFSLDCGVDAFAAAMEKAGIPLGQPIDAARCRLWPVGVSLKLTPALSTVLTNLDNSAHAIVYTGGRRLEKGMPDAATNMPLAVFATYDLPQALLQFNGSFNQGDVYGRYLPARKFEKGEKVTFTLSWSGTPCKHVTLPVKPGSISEGLKSLREQSSDSQIDVLADFDPSLTVEEAAAAATALSFVDSVNVKINGRPEGRFFYRAFLPLEKWRDRKERLLQPFELTLGETNRLVVIDEDWNVPGDDPKLTEKTISIAEAANYPKINTCFIYARASDRLEKLYASIREMPKFIVNWYVYPIEGK